MATKSRKKAKTRQTTEGSGILSRAKPVQEGDEFTTSLFYGRSGTGKTTLASTYPKPILLLDYKDRGTDSIRDVESIDVIRMDHWTDVEDVYWAIRENSKYQTIVLDTVSGMQNLAISKVKEDNNVDDADHLSRRGWGEVAGMLNTWLMIYRDLNMHVVFLASDRTKRSSDDEEDTTPEEGRLEPEVGPAVIPSVAIALNASVKIIGNTFIRQRQKMKEGKVVEITSYVLRIGPHPYYITKIRSPKSVRIPGVIVDPSYSKIVNVMKGETSG